MYRDAAIYSVLNSHYSSCTATLVCDYCLSYCSSALPAMFVGLVMISILLISATSVTAQKAIIGDTIHTMEGDPIVNGVVLIRDGKIEWVGPAAEVAIPADYERFQGMVVTPGIIDARSVVGIAGYYNQDHDQDQLEYSHALQPDLRAIDACNSREELVGFLLKNGITTMHTGHAPVPGEIHKTRHSIPVKSRVKREFLSPFRADMRHMSQKPASLCSKQLWPLDTVLTK